MQPQPPPVALVCAAPTLNADCESRVAPSRQYAHLKSSLLAKAGGKLAPEIRSKRRCGQAAAKNRLQQAKDAGPERVLRLTLLRFQCAAGVWAGQPGGYVVARPAATSL